MKTLLVVALASALAFSGCAGSNESSDDLGTTQNQADGTSEATIQGGGNGGSGGNGGNGGNGGGGSAENKAPSGTLKASIKTGEVPLKVNFTMEGADVDGDALSWTLDADGDGEPDASGPAPATFPVVANFTYTAPGEFKAKYTLSDGKLDVFYLVNITASASELPPPSSGPVIVQEETGTILLSGPSACQPFGGYPNLSGNRPDHVGFEPLPESVGAQFETEFTTTGPITTLKVQFWAGGGTIVAEFTAASGDTVTGTVPDGADSVIISVCGASPNTGVHYVATQY